MADTLQIAPFPEWDVLFTPADLRAASVSLECLIHSFAAFDNSANPTASAHQEGPKPVPAASPVGAAEPREPDHDAASGDGPSPPAEGRTASVFFPGGGEEELEEGGADVQHSLALRSRVLKRHIKAAATPYTRAPSKQPASPNSSTSSPSPAAAPASRTSPPLHLVYYDLEGKAEALRAEINVLEIQAECLRSVICRVHKNVDVNEGAASAHPSTSATVVKKEDTCTMVSQSRGGKRGSRR
jgi:hypothetical protein